MKEIIKLNADNLDYMAMSAKLICHYGAKILISEAIYRKRHDLAEKVQTYLKYEGDAIKAGCLWLRNDVMKLTEEQIANAIAICASHCLPIGILDADREEMTMMKNLRFGFVLLSVLLAILSKPSAVVFPAIVARIAIPSLTVI
jgi:hypothetical protein